MAACVNAHSWPVLAGPPGDGSLLLATPIILEDHPRVAPESPGDLFDGGEIDQLLILNTLALTDAEKAEIRATDPRTREILDRVEPLTPSPQMPETRLPPDAASRYVVVDYERYLPVAPGMVLIKAAGHTPGSQMVYVALEAAELEEE